MISRWQQDHKIFLIRILKDIYGYPSIGPLLGFKGGTAAMMFYNLPRLSVDLDFDLLDSQSKDKVFQTLSRILPKFGQLQEAVEKHYTLFYLISYRKGLKKIKVEVSKKPSPAEFKIRHYLGIPVLVMTKDDMFASKLSAFLTRKKLAPRDLFDLWFFFENQWTIDEKFFQAKTGISLRKGLEKAIKKLEKIPTTQLLQGLGDLLNTDKQKDFVRHKLKEELAFYLNLYKNQLTT